METKKPIIYQDEQLPEIAASIEQIGYAVVKIDTVDLTQLKQTFISELSYIARDILELWTSDKFPEPVMPGLMGEYGLSQGNAAWQVRTDPTIQKVFAYLQDTDDLVCSMDAVGYSPDNAKVSGSQWLHTDQNPEITGGDFKSLQGIFYAEDSYGDRAGTVVVPGSHKDYLDHNYFQPGHFQIVNHDKYWQDAVKLEIPAGCILIYSSYLVHQGWHGPHRLCFMVSYGKKSDRSEEVRKAKIMMYLGGHRSTHWSQFAQYHGRKWFYDTEWQILPSKLTCERNTLLTHHLTSITTDPKAYRPEFDEFVPADRLKLL